MIDGNTTFVDSAEVLGDDGWGKSSFSSPNGNCVELKQINENQIAVRHSRDPKGPALIYSRAEIGAFFKGVEAGEFDASLGILRD